eukprot:GHVT01067353.1.p1 GENE.GHVT01067353.1~~GHVT01067353.1.p1  ORF type:complete len:176 (-),score=24.61 GHVT01067353.1:423-950(-)
MVPFRLTKNIIAPMGPLGTLGQFQEACFHTLRTIRENKETLHSLLLTLVLDPLLVREEGKVDGEMRWWLEAQPQGPALADLADVSGRLGGAIGIPASVDSRPLDAPNADPLALLRQIKKRRESALAEEFDFKDLSKLFFNTEVGSSVEEQVEGLIRAAVCPYNMAAMFFGWLPWI